MDESRPSPLDRSVFQRTGRTSPLGKLDDRIEAFRIESIVKARLAVLAAERGKPLSEIMQLAARLLVFSPEELKSMQNEDVDVVAGLLFRHSRKDSEG